jgi:hypothetical protein
MTDARKLPAPTMAPTPMNAGTVRYLTWNR